MEAGQGIGHLCIREDGVDVVVGRHSFKTGSRILQSRLLSGARGSSGGSRGVQGSELGICSELEKCTREKRQSDEGEKTRKGERERSSGCGGGRRRRQWVRVAGTVPG